MAKSDLLSHSAVLIFLSFLFLFFFTPNGIFNVFFVITFPLSQLQFY